MPPPSTWISASPRFDRLSDAEICDAVAMLLHMSVAPPCAVAESLCRRCLKLHNNTGEHAHTCLTASSDPHSHFRARVQRVRLFDVRACDVDACGRLARWQLAWARVRTLSGDLDAGLQEHSGSAQCCTLRTCKCAASHSFAAAAKIYYMNFIRTFLSGPLRSFFAY